MNAKVSPLKADLLESKNEYETLGESLSMLETNITSLQQAKNDLTDQKQELLLVIDGLETDVESARDKISTLETDLNCAQETAALEQEQLNAKVSSLEANLKASKEENENLGLSLSMLETNITSLEQAKNDLIDQKQELLLVVDGLETDVESAKETAALEQEQLNSKVSSLEADLLKSMEESERLGQTIKVLEIEHSDALARAENDKSTAIHELEKQM